MRARWATFWLAVTALLSVQCGDAAAQGAIRQQGPVTGFHLPAWSANGVQIDAGKVTAPYINALGLYGGSSCPFGVSSQSTPGTSLSAYSQFSICQTPTTTTFVVQGMNGQTTPNVYFKIGGVNYPFPGSGSGGVVGPGTSVIGHFSCWNSTNGTVLSDCGGGTVIGPGTTVVGDISCWNSTTGVALSDCGPLGTAAAKNTGTSGANLCPVNAGCVWSGANSWALNFDGSTTLPTNYPIIYHSGAFSQGIVSPRSAVILQLVGIPSSGVGSGEVNIVDGFAYNGYAYYSAERYDRGGPNNGAVLSGENIGGYGFSPYDGVSDANTAGIGATASENQVNDTHHGTKVNITYTPNNAGSNKRYNGICISCGGAGGIALGDTSYQSPPTDEGPGTVNIATALYANNGDTVADSTAHLRGMAGAGAPTINNSGTVVAGSTDNRGEITGGSSTTNWTVGWHTNWPTRPFCTVTPLSHTAPSFDIAPSVSSLGVVFSSAYNGGFDWTCL